MNRGKLIQYGVIKRPTYDVVSGQSTLVGYADYSPLFIYVKSVSGGEEEDSYQNYSEETFSLTCSYVEGILNDDVLELESNIYDIVSVFPKLKDNVIDLKVKLKDNYDG